MAAQDQSIVDLLKAAISDAQELIRSELALAKAEVRQEVSRIQVGIAALPARRSPCSSPSSCWR